MSSRGGTYEGPGGEELYGDGREVDPIASTPSPARKAARNISDLHTFSAIGEIEHNFCGVCGQHLTDGVHSRSGETSKLAIERIISSCYAEWEKAIAELLEIIEEVPRSHFFFERLQRAAEALRSRM